MYSAVLMLALTAGSETADFGRNRCSSACSTAVVVSCSRAASHSCHARTPLFGNRCSHSCAKSHGCASSHHHGCTTTRVVVAHCSTSHACSNSCHRGGLFSRLKDRRCHSSCAVTHGCSTGTTIIIEKKKEMPKAEEIKKPKTTSLSAPATIVVSLPAGARLIVDGNQTNSVSESRTLVTPELDFGTTYVYTMQVEIVREGRTVSQTQEVNVRGGETTTVQFTFPNQGVASR